MGGGGVGILGPAESPPPPSPREVSMLQGKDGALHTSQTYIASVLPKDDKFVSLIWVCLGGIGPFTWAYAHLMSVW